MVRVLGFSALVAALAASVAQATADFKLSGINYNIRAGPDWADASTKCKPTSQIATELALLKQYTDVIRLYSLTDCEQATAVIPAAISAGLQIELGLWIDSYETSYPSEKAAFETLLATGVVTSDNIVSIHVGSEAVYRGDITAATAITYLGEIRDLCAATDGASDIPLTIADIGDTYTAHPEMIEAVDFVSANYFPFWEKIDIDEAVGYFYERFEALVKTAADYSKEVVLGETGWASDGVDSAASAATAANAAEYFYGFYNLANEIGLTYYYFSAFDEPWKLATLDANETVEAYFGLFTVDGELKPDVAALTFNSTSVTASASTAGSAVADVSIDASSSSSSTYGGAATVGDDTDSDDDDSADGDVSVGDDDSTASAGTETTTLADSATTTTTADSATTTTSTDAATSSTDADSATTTTTTSTDATTSTGGSSAATTTTTVTSAKDCAMV